MCRYDVTDERHLATGRSTYRGYLNGTTPAVLGSFDDAALARRAVDDAYQRGATR